MQKTFLISLALFCLLICGCASNVVPMGKDTYMIEHGGWPDMSEAPLEADCLRDANHFCDKKGMAMETVSITGINGRAFINNASCKLVFRTIPKGSPQDVPPNMARDTNSENIMVNKQSQ
jgi:hypothetical protein